MTKKKMKKMQDLYIELIENSEAKKYFEAETKFKIGRASCRERVS